MNSSATSARTVTLQGQPLALAGRPPVIDDSAPEFSLVFSRRPEDASADGGFAMPELRQVGLDDYRHRIKLLNIFPSIDTPICADSVRACELFARSHPKHALLMISADLPFAMQRFCADHSIKNLFALSTMGDTRFGRDYGVGIDTEPLRGLCARACFVLDTANKVRQGSTPFSRTVWKGGLWPAHGASARQGFRSHRSLAASCRPKRANACC